ncbi:hypothetical protein [Sphaerotilus sp.]|uniref:hypothetical protein n=1 Tax=Sphaerotilus sp. TaxID=2093942 RepID=UPI002ACEADF6|nr:hypothetical protein [Sphaerotilus sp.]MDZ7857935.1 hypothetical protein [Sphaerotilus sp.]
MTNGDDIHNLLKTLGHDAGIYQDLAKYNAARAAVRRAAMGRPAEPLATPAASAQAPAAPTAPAAAASPAGGVPRVLRLGPDAHNGISSVTSILNRLASPHDTATVPGPGAGQPAARSPTPAATPQPVRLDRLFGRLASRPADPLGR